MRRLKAIAWNSKAPAPLSRCWRGKQRADAMRAFALLIAILVMVWAVDAVVYDGYYGGQIYQGIHKQGQKLRAEVKQRLNTDKT
jgi:hypothetical protein